MSTIQKAQDEKNILAILFLIIITIIFSKCKSTEKNAYGLWVDALDTLEFKSDKTFGLRRCFIDDTVNILNNSSYGMTLHIYKGTWVLRENTIYFNFNDLKDQEKFGWCKSGRLRKGFFRRSTIMTGASCKFPSKPVYYVKVN